MSEIAKSTHSCDFTCILSHLMGTFYQTIHMLRHGIKPVYAFDGKPPQGQGRRADAEKLLAQVQETGEQENIDKFSKRLVEVTWQHNDECKKLLTLMGVPYIKAPCEASCAALVKAGKVVATATEDTDSLTFGAGVLLRHLTTSDAKHYCSFYTTLLCVCVGYLFLRLLITFRFLYLRKHPILLVCLLGPLQKHPAPEVWLYKEARGLFLQPDVVDCSTVDLKWSEPDEDALIQFVCRETVQNYIKNVCKKMMKSRQGSTPG
uniref:Flap structure-specific endonuclease 1 n=1 Tax=Salmo trutta TaxID=8032 RepID=A0A673VMD8_SALTR